MAIKLMAVKLKLHFYLFLQFLSRIEFRHHHKREIKFLPYLCNRKQNYRIMKIKFILFFSLSVLAISSCKENEEETINPAREKILADGLNI